ncbi:MAG: hypothetical protein ACYC26_17275 [Phycisphaerales bacterium]
MRRTTTRRFVTDAKGKKTGVILGITEYEKLLDQIDELDAIRAYDAAKSSDEKPVRFEQAMRVVA